MKKIAIIPVRMGSSRFPGKPLKKINGIPMIKIIYDEAKKNKNLDAVVVATCDQIIFKYIKTFDGNVVMTKKTHNRATERTAEAIRLWEKKTKKKYSIVVMIQGDEPMLNYKMIDMATKPFKDKNVNVVNLISKIKDQHLMNDKNCIKIIKDKNNNAVYFSRSPIPYFNKKKNYYGYKQVCIIPFRKNFLFNYIKLKESRLEIAESVDMLRILENNNKVRLVEIKNDTYPVDTIHDLKKVSILMKKK